MKCISIVKEDKFHNVKDEWLILAEANHIVTIRMLMTKLAVVLLHVQHNAPDSKVHGANMGPIWADRTQVGHMLVPWTLLSRTVNFHKKTQYTACSRPLNVTYRGLVRSKVYIPLFHFHPISYHMILGGNCLRLIQPLNHQGHVTHICVSKLGHHWFR